MTCVCHQFSAIQIHATSFSQMYEYLFNKKGKLFHANLFSEWIIEMDHHDCTTGGGGGVHE
jgi:hypothetical protein